MGDSNKIFPFEIEFFSELAYLDLVYNIVREISEVLNFEKRDTVRLSVAVSEAVTNAIIHGNGNDASRKVRLAIVMESSFLRVDVTDEGNGGFRFDPARHGLLNENDIELENGRGIYIMICYTDKLEYAQTESRGTRVSLIKYLSQGGEVQ